MLEEFDKSNIDYKKIAFILIGIVAVIGLAIFGVVSLLGGDKEKKKPEEEEQINYSGPTLEITSERVVALYNYINGCSSSSPAEPFDYFYTNKKVKAQDIPTNDKLQCAFQYIGKTNIVNENGIYYIPMASFEGGMNTFFGENVTFKKKDLIKDPLLLYIDMENTNADYATVTYDETTERFPVTFGEATETTESVGISKYYTKLVGANKIDDGIVLKEKIIYVKDVSTEGKYNFNIYSDYKQENKLSSKSNASLSNISINIDDYLDSASTIYYVFKFSSDGHYYFSSSEIDTK